MFDIQLNTGILVLFRFLLVRFQIMKENWPNANFSALQPNAWKGHCKPGRQKKNLCDRDGAAEGLSTQSQKGKNKQ